jgi:GT2 family glycosyltransferase
MHIYVSFISHGHQKIISNSDLLDSLEGLKVILRENKPTEQHCVDIKVQCIQNLRIRGFGENHNKNFEVVNPDDNDWFVICNPDIVVESKTIREIRQYCG